MIADTYLLIPIFFAIALIYSSVGFGGGSSYLAILALFTIDYSIIRSTALICNIVVVSSGVFFFYRKNLLELGKIWPLILFSIPMAYLAGRMPINQSLFLIILGFALLLASIFMVFPLHIYTKRKIENNWISNSMIGGGIGFLAGLVGIGGGIFLAPVLHISKWDNAKKIAASCCLFILVNSIAGLLGQISNSVFRIDYYLIASLGIAVFIGGQIGSRLAINRLNANMVKQITALLIFIVALRILLKELVFY